MGGEFGEILCDALYSGSTEVVDLVQEMPHVVDHTAVGLVVGVRNWYPVEFE